MTFVLHTEKESQSTKDWLKIKTGLNFLYTQSVAITQMIIVDQSQQIQSVIWSEG